MNPKIIIFYTPCGAGHRRAAESIAEGFKRSGHPDERVIIKNSLEFVNKLAGKLYVKGYDFLLKHALLLWAFFYSVTDVKFSAPFFKVLRRVYNELTCKGLVKFIKEQSPDVIICTHFLPEEIVCSMKKKGLYERRLVTCVTDLRVHSFWILDGVDDYVVGGEEGKKDLLRWGVEEKKIKVFGIPVHPEFSNDLDRQKLCEKLGIKDSVFTILVTAGGLGIGPVKKIVQSLTIISEELQILVVCGKSPKLFKDLTAFARSSLEISEPSPYAMNKKKICIFEFVNNMHEIMSVSDIIISKAGGSTVAEALAKQLPIIIIRPIPGQEIKNTEVLVSNNAGIRAYNVQQAIESVRFLMKDKDHILELKKGIQKIRKPHSAIDICRLVSK